MIKSVEIVTVSKIIPIYKEGQEANAIQVINFNFENGDECGYNVIAQKGLYEIGSKAVYVQPDFCLSDISLFKSFTAPFDDPKKSKLGKNNRIRAVKFNFQFEHSSDPIYSYGVLLPLTEVNDYIKADYNPEELDVILGITKYEEPETGGNGLVKGGLPHFLYSTDEENSKNLKSHINKVLATGQRIGYTFKTDGCLDENTLIETENDGLLTIKYICDTKYKGKIKSFNPYNNIIEYNNIINHSIKSNNNDWYEIELSNNKILKVTGNHRIWINNLKCYRKVEDLDGTEIFLE